MNIYLCHTLSVVIPRYAWEFDVNTGNSLYVWYSAGLVKIKSKSESLISLFKLDSVKSGVTCISNSSFSPFSN